MVDRLWPSFKAEFFERETQCVARGEDNGRREVPSSDEVSLSEAEIDIIDKINDSINIEIFKAEQSLKDKEKKN